MYCADRHKKCRRRARASAIRASGAHMTHTLSWSARAASCDPPKAQKKGVREHAGRVALRCVWLGVEGLGGIEISQDELHAPGLLHAHSQERALAGRKSLTVSLLDVPEHSGCEANLPQKIQFFWGRIGVTNQKLPIMT